MKKPVHELMEEGTGRYDEKNSPFFKEMGYPPWQVFKKDIRDVWFAVPINTGLPEVSPPVLRTKDNPTKRQMPAVVTEYPPNFMSIINEWQNRTGYRQYFQNKLPGKAIVLSLPALMK